MEIAHNLRLEISVFTGCATDPSICYSVVSVCVHVHASMQVCARAMVCMQCMVFAVYLAVFGCTVKWWLVDSYRLNQPNTAKENEVLKSIQSMHQKGVLCPPPPPNLNTTRNKFNPQILSSIS